MKTLPSQFYDEPIEVAFDEDPVYAKRPECPNAFHWRDEEFRIVEVLSEEQNFERHGKSARNMVPGHAATASRVGSWGVGRYFFCVIVENGRIFDIYFDRAPQGAGDRKGHWFIKGERIRAEE
jgi:hypothetical protein